MKCSRMAITLTTALLLTAMMCSSSLWAQSRVYTKTTALRAPRNMRLAKVESISTLDTELKAAAELETTHTSSTCTSCSRTNSSFTRCNSGCSSCNRGCNSCCFLDWNLLPRIASGIEDAIDSLLPCCSCSGCNTSPCESSCSSGCRLPWAGGWNLRPINFCLPVPSFFRCNDCCDDSLAGDPGLIIEEEAVPLILPGNGDENSPPKPPRPPKSARNNPTLHEVHRSSSESIHLQNRPIMSPRKSKPQQVGRKKSQVANYRLEALRRVQKRLAKNADSANKATPTNASISRKKRSLSNQMFAAPAPAAKGKGQSLSAIMFASPNAPAVENIAPARLLEREASSVRSRVVIRLTSGQTPASDNTPANPLRK